MSPDGPGVSFEPTLSPTESPAGLGDPTISPTLSPSLSTTLSPDGGSLEPTLSPTLSPEEFSLGPTLSPTPDDSLEPTLAPSLDSSIEPTLSPLDVSLEPTLAPSLDSSIEPTLSPLDISLEPTLAPSLDRSLEPTPEDVNISPTLAPSSDPDFSTASPLPSLDSSSLTLMPSLRKDTERPSMTISDKPRPCGPKSKSSKTTYIDCEHDYDWAEDDVMSYNNILGGPIYGFGKSGKAGSQGPTNTTIKDDEGRNIDSSKSNKSGNFISKNATINGLGKSGKAGTNYDEHHGKKSQGQTNTTIIDDEGRKIDSKAVKGPDIVYVVKPKANKATKTHNRTEAESAFHSPEIANPSAKPNDSSHVPIVDPANASASSYAKAGKISKKSKKLGGFGPAVANSKDDLSLPHEKVSKSSKRSGGFNLLTAKSSTDGLSLPRKFSKPKSGKYFSISFEVDASNVNETLPLSVPTGSSTPMQISASNNTNDSTLAANKAPSLGAQFIGSHSQTSRAKSEKAIQPTIPTSTPSISIKRSSSGHSKQSKAAKHEKKHLGTPVSSTSSSTSDTSNWAKGVTFSGYRTKTPEAESSNVKITSSAASTGKQPGIRIFTLATLGFLVFCN